jgi:hypothetical protein
VRSLIKLHMYTIGSGNDAEMKDALSSLLRGLALTDG